MNIHEQLRTAMAQHHAGCTSDAERLYCEILAQVPDCADALHLLGVLCAQDGRHHQGVELIRKAIARQPGTAGFYVNLARACLSAGNTLEAIAALREAARLNPRDCEIQLQLSKVLRDNGEMDEAMEVLDRLVEVRPELARAWSNRASVLRSLGKFADAAASARRAIEIDGICSEACLTLALCLWDLVKLDEALPAALRAVELDQKSGPAHNILAAILKDDGQLEASLAELDKAVELDPTDWIFLSNKIYTLEFDPRADPQSLLAQQRLWNQRHAEPLGHLIRPHDNDRNPNRRLRVGYLSPYFCSHAESFFVVPLLESHDERQVEIFCYSDTANLDHVSDRFKNAADFWQDTWELSVEQLVERIRSDRIDILVHLAMHMAHNRSLAFAQKPAPVQIAWLAYPGGMGLDAIDYRITDPWIDPIGMDESCYHEKSIRLPRTWVCYDPMIEAQPAVPRQPGPIRFGSVNNPCKLNEPLLELWSEVLRAVPDSQLLLQANTAGHRARIKSFFQSRGIAAERIRFAVRCGRPKYLRVYDRIDICLDPLPYNGITTSCDALWMGVPIVTLTGRTAAGRAGASILQNVGLPELIARTPQQFVEIAADLAADSARLAHLRQTLRPQFESSPMMNATQFARDMEAAYRQMWQTWCAGTK